MLKFAKPLAYNTQISFELSKEAIAEYNQAMGTNYEALPEELITLPKELTLQKGQSKTPKLSLNVKITDDVKLNTPYIFVVQVKDMLVFSYSLITLAWFIRSFATKLLRILSVQWN